MKDKIINWIKNQELYQVSSVDKKRTNKIKGKILDDAILRSVASNEIVIEYDIDVLTKSKFLISQTIKRLNANGYNFCVFDHKSRSPHIHIYGIEGLQEQDSEVRRKYKQYFLKKYAASADYSLCKPNQLIAMEFKPHFKHHTIKSLVRVFGEKKISNTLELPLLNLSINYIESQKEKKEYIDNSNNEWFINWINEEIQTIPSGHRNNIIAKNYCILMNNKQQMKGLPWEFQRMVMGWSPWKNEKPRRFLLQEIYTFGNIYGYTITEIIKKYTHGDPKNDIRQNS